MATYQVTSTGTILRDDGANIPPDPRNADYRAYQAWVAAGNTAPILPPPPRAQADINADALRANLLPTLPVNRNLAAQTDAILAYTSAVVADASTDTSTANLLGAVKQLANAVHTLAQHSAENWSQHNGLIRTELSVYDGTN